MQYKPPSPDVCSPGKLAAKGQGPIPLGKTLPDSPHAVFCSLPSIRSVIAYEEKEPTLCRKMRGGYPRFFNSLLTQKLEKLLVKEQGQLSKTVRLVSSKKMGRKLMAYLPLQSRARLQSRGKMNWISFADEPLFRERVQDFLQHSGAMVFSREAEDMLFARGALAQKYPETYLTKNARQKIWGSLCRDLQIKRERDIFLARCGMSAIFASYLAISKIQQPKGRTIWIQLGWLYLDTIQVLKKFAPREEDYIHLPNILDLQALEDILILLPNRVAAVVTEIPTNPLLYTPNLAKLSELCKKAGVALVLDPSLAGIPNVQILPYCDMVVSSLTKYYGWSGDIIMGMIVLNQHSPFYGELYEFLPGYIEAPYKRDIKRFALLLEKFPAIMDKINQNTIEFVDFLNSQPFIKKLYWAYGPFSHKNYRAIEREGGRPGGVLSFELNMPLSDFYDRIAIPKGPSFGTVFNILCPFLYLAHYDLVKTSRGRKYLYRNGINPDLLRLSVGIGPVAELRAAFTEALG